MADAGPSSTGSRLTLASAAFWAAGQNCTAGSRTLVDPSIKDEFVSALARRRSGAPSATRSTNGTVSARSSRLTR